MVSNQFANAHHHHHHQHAAANQGGKLIATYPPSFHALRYANLFLIRWFYWILLNFQICSLSNGSNWNAIGSDCLSVDKCCAKSSTATTKSSAHGSPNISRLQFLECRHVRFQWNRLGIDVWHVRINCINFSPNLLLYSCIQVLIWHFLLF